MNPVTTMKITESLMSEDDYVDIQNNDKKDETSCTSKRKRKPDKNKWNREENKMKRQRGTTYKGLRKTAEGKWSADQERAGRKLKPACNCKLSGQKTKLQCRMFSESDRKAIFEKFWKNMSWQEKRVFVQTLVDVVPAKNKKKSSPGNFSSIKYSIVSLKERWNTFKSV